CSPVPTLLCSSFPALPWPDGQGRSWNAFRVCRLSPLLFLRNPSRHPLWRRRFDNSCPDSFGANLSSLRPFEYMDEGGLSDEGHSSEHSDIRHEREGQLLLVAHGNALRHFPWLA